MEKTLRDPDGTKYMVLDEHTLCYQRQGMNGLGILWASVLRGSPYPLHGEVPIPLDKSKMRPATLKDFEDFGVSPPSIEAIEESTRLQQE